MLTSADLQALCASAGLLHVLLAALGAAGPGARGAPPLLIKWLCLCLGRLCQDMPQARPWYCYAVCTHRCVHTHVYPRGASWPLSRGQNGTGAAVVMQRPLEVKHMVVCLRR